MNSSWPPYGRQPVSLPMSPLAAAPQPRRPRAVDLAWWLTLGGAVLFLVLLIVDVAGSWNDILAAARRGLVADGQPFTERDVQTDAKGTAFVLMAFGAAIAAPFVTFGALLLKGRNWTRVVLTVLLSIGAFLSAVLMLPVFTGGIAGVLLAAVLVGLAIWVIVLLFSRAANEFFAGPR